jgi:hypothetical protein
MGANTRDLGMENTSLRIDHMTNGSIHWDKITDRMKVIETKTHFEAAGKLVTWGSRDAKIAQTWLLRRAHSDKIRFSKGRK